VSGAVGGQAAPGVAGRLAKVRRRIALACARAGRAPGEVTLVGIAKGQPLERVVEALTLGLDDLGESYAQELVRRREELHRLAAAPPAALDLAALRWHFVGHLQRNKVKLVVPGCVLIHSLDSLRLLQVLGRQVREAGVTQHVLLEVGTGEATKTGVQPDEVRSLARAVFAEEGLLLDGLMGMAPFDSAPEEARQTFAGLRRLRDALQQELGVALPHLSMGMSGDLEQAVEEGATLVRVGEALFGPRAR